MNFPLQDTPQRSTEMLSRMKVMVAAGSQAGSPASKQGHVRIDLFPHKLESVPRQTSWIDGPTLTRAESGQKQQ